jgi:tight adherence protein C
MNALGRIVKEFRKCPTTEELSILIQEVRVGKRRRDALRSFSARVQTAEASSFSRTLVQADRMGTGIAEALQVLSEDMRLARYHWAERFAQQAPVKMLVPLLFSLASAMIIVAGPILGQFLQGGFSAAQYNLSAAGEK